MPSSDEEGGSGAAADGKRDNAPSEFERSTPVLRNGLLSLSHRYAMPAPSSEGAKAGSARSLLLPHWFATVGQNDRRETTVFLPIDPRQENCVGGASNGLLSLSHRYAMPAPSSEGAEAG